MTAYRRMIELTAENDALAQAEVEQREDGRIDLNDFRARDVARIRADAYSRAAYEISRYRRRHFWMVVFAVGVLALAYLLVGCGPSGDPHEPNPLDLGAPLPCQAALSVDATIAVEVIDQQGRLVGTDVLVMRDAVSIVGTGGRGGYAIDVPEGRNLPWESNERAPYCWHILLRPEVTEAIVTLKAVHALLPGERLVCYTFDADGFVPNKRSGFYVENKKTGVATVNCSATVTKRGS